MVRALPRLPTLDLDAKRIAANSFVIALHAAALMLLMAPVAWAPPMDVEETTTAVQFIEPIRPIPPIPVLPTANPSPRPNPLPQQIVHTTNPPIATTTDIVDSQGTELVAIDNPPTEIIATGNGEPALTQLALLHGPAPQYPRQALRERLQGEVLLRVLVDANGVPQDVVIEHSSGYRLLDQAALREVRASWRFQPAIVDGRNVPAYALVPINFRLSN